MAVPSKVIYCHHFDDLAQKTVAAIAAKVHQAGATEFAPKIWQSNYLMGASGKDKGALAPKTLDELVSLYQAFKAQGVTLTPYGVVFGDDWAAAAGFAVEVAKRCGGVVELDLEPYADFWTTQRDKVDDFAKAVTSSGARLNINADLRDSAMSQFPQDALKAAFAVASRVLGQCYYMTFTNHVATTFPTRATSYGGGTGWVDKLTDYLKGMGVAPQKRGMILDSPGWRQFGDAAIALNLRDSKCVGLWSLQDADDTTLWAFEAIGGATQIQVVSETTTVEKPVYPDAAAVAAIDKQLEDAQTALKTLPGM